METDLRNGFYSATNNVNHLIANVKGWSEAVPDQVSKNNLINFLTDGYLNTAETDKFIGSEYSELRKNAYESQLTTAYLGIQIINSLNPAGVTLNKGTKDNVVELMNKYQRDGGKKDFSDLKKIME